MAAKVSAVIATGIACASVFVHIVGQSDPKDRTSPEDDVDSGLLRAKELEGWMEHPLLGHDVRADLSLEMRTATRGRWQLGDQEEDIFVKKVGSSIRISDLNKETVMQGRVDSDGVFTGIFKSGGAKGGRVKLWPVRTNNKAFSSKKEAVSSKREEKQKTQDVPERSSDSLGGFMLEAFLACGAVCMSYCVFCAAKLRLQGRPQLKAACRKMDVDTKHEVGASGRAAEDSCPSPSATRSTVVSEISDDDLLGKSSSCDSTLAGTVASQLSSVGSVSSISSDEDFGDAERDAERRPTVEEVLPNLAEMVAHPEKHVYVVDEETRRLTSWAAAFGDGQNESQEVGAADWEHDGDAEKADGETLQETPQEYVCCFYDPKTNTFIPWATMFGEGVGCPFQVPNGEVLTGVY